MKVAGVFRSFGVVDRCRVANQILFEDSAEPFFFARIVISALLPQVFTRNTVVGVPKLDLEKMLKKRTEKTGGTKKNQTNINATPNKLSIQPWLVPSASPPCLCSH
jgi:hypothetical protein